MNTIIEWQRQGREVLKKGKVQNTEMEVDYLLSGILGLSRAELYLNNSSCEIDEEKGCRIFQALEERLAGVPLQYILGEVEFFSLPFYVRPGVFIPRPETELLVEEAINTISLGGCEAGREGGILDLCTGCGNIALSLAQNTNLKVVATDISPLSLKIARENAIRLGLSDRVEFLQGDLFKPLYNKAFFIISNPPYISSREWDSLPEEVKYYEPRQAIFGGRDGGDFYKRISKEAKVFIKKGGYLLLEVGPATEVTSILKKDGWQDIKIIKDYNNFDRIISCRRIEF